jgi:hypothetical protein
VTDYSALSHYRLLADGALAGLPHVTFPAEHLAAIVGAQQEELCQLRRTVAHLRLDIDRLNTRTGPGQ